MKEMLPDKIRKLVSLKKGEEVLGCYGCHLDNVKGYAVLTSNDLVFVQGGGGFDNVYTMELTVPYKKIDEVTKAPGNTVFLKVSGRPYTIRLDTIDVPIKGLQETLTQRIEARS
ncbi:hypothetical protein JXL21_05015 [Candidatus Bathyarchaeota archaeon]|nr:hypothetical protein [Candidatus Bathyarchaeota archaeon]